MDSLLFTPVTLGPLTLRNRSIRSAAFESMCPGNVPSPQLLDYHRSVAAGGVGMTTVAYAAVTRSGLSFDRQLWMRPEIVPGLRELTDAVHAEGAAASIQLGHCGNMSHKSICGCLPVGASSGFNLYSPTFVRGLRADELPEMAKAYGRSVCLAREAGFDAVQMGRALLNEPDFVNRMRREENARCNCRHSNYCIARMYTLDMACHQHLQEELPPCLKKEIERIESKG